jgi:dTDP-4-amino-4,6-dideoxygalactose transaminase
MRPRIPSIGQVHGYLAGMDERRVYTNFGPLVAELEARYALRYAVPADCVVACANATLGLEGAVSLSPATRFHCPAWTFPATPLAVVNARKALSFRDVRRADWQIDAPRSGPADALLPVLPFGAHIDLAAWSEWSEVVVDAAASGGSLSRSLAGLAAGWAVVVSLHATKVLGIGEGGLVVFGDPDRADRFRSFLTLGFAGRRESDFVGTNAKMSEIAAAYGLAALDNWDCEESEWATARERVSTAERHLRIASLCASYGGANPYWIVDLANPAAMRRAEAALTSAGIGTRRWWPTPCTRMGAFRDSWGGLATPVSDALAETTLGLPFYRDITATDVDRVASVLAEVLRP